MSPNEEHVIHAERSEPHRKEGTGRRILVVDDSHEAREALGQIFARCGYAVETASDGAAAIDRLKATPVDAVVLDLQMPEHDGFETLAYIRDHRRGLPTLLLTGMPPDDIQHEMLRSGTDELPPLFMKPVDPDQILTVLDLLLTGELPPRVS